MKGATEAVKEAKAIDEVKKEVPSAPIVISAEG